MTSIPLIHSSERQVATLWLSDMLLGIDIHQIREILRVGEITPVPAAPPAVQGVINLRGDVVTVVDLRRILGLPATDLTIQSRLVIVESEGERIGLLVDRVADVLTTNPETREPLPANLRPAKARLFHDVYKLERDVLVTLNVDAALNEALLTSHPV